MKLDLADFLGRVVNAIGILLAAVFAWLLFFLWYPDFVTWISLKAETVSNVTAARTLLELSPMLVLLIGLALLVSLVFSSISPLANQEEKPSG